MEGNDGKKSRVEEYQRLVDKTSGPTVDEVLEAARRAEKYSLEVERVENVERNSQKTRVSNSSS